MEPRISIVTLGVEDLDRACNFYQHGLGFPTNREPGEGIAFFQTNGVYLALYPNDKLAEDLSPSRVTDRGQFSGVTLAHTARRQEDVNDILARAESAGGKIEKPAQDSFWGGYSGYFSDPDGHLWEVAYAEFWQFNEDGRVIIE